MRQTLVLIAFIAVAATSLAQVTVYPSSRMSGTFANRPTCVASLEGFIYEVTDATADGDCSAGSGAGSAECVCQSSVWNAKALQGLTWNVTVATCTGDGNGGALTVNGSSQIICSADDGGAGSGDAIEVEDGDDGGTFTAVDTTAQFEDSADINFAHVDGGAGGPDQITGTIRANSVALATDTTGSYVEQVADGTGIDGTANAEQATYTPSLDLTEINSFTWSDNSQATITHTVNTSGASDPIWTYTDGNANLSTGNLQEGGVDVVTTSTDDDIPEAADYSNLTGGAGIVNSPTGTIATASTESAFLTDGGAVSLTCGASNQGRIQVMDDGALQYCDGATTSLLADGYLDADGVDDTGTDTLDDLSDDLITALSGVTTVTDGSYCQGGATSTMDCDVTQDNIPGAGHIDATAELAGALCGTNEILEDQGASWACIATPGGGGNSFGIVTDGSTPAGSDTGNDTLTVTDSATIDFITSDAPEDLTANFLPAGVGAATWLDNADRTWTFDIAAAGTNPTMAFAASSIEVDAELTIDNQQALRWKEGDGGGENYLELQAPATVTSNQTCTLEDDANFIPDSCVGDGTDGVGTDTLDDLSDDSITALSDVTATTGTGTTVVFSAAPVFTGDATTATPAVDDNDTSIATTAFVQAETVAAGDVTGTIGGGLTIGAGVVEETMMSTEDFGDFSCGAGADDCLLDSGVVDSTAIATDTITASNVAASLDTRSTQVIWEDPAATDEFVVKLPPVTGTMTRVDCETVGATSITINICDGEDAGDDTCATSIFDAVASTTLTCTDAGASDATLNATGFVARDDVTIVVTAVSGTPTQAIVYITSTVD